MAGVGLFLRTTGRRECARVAVGRCRKRLRFSTSGKAGDSTVAEADGVTGAQAGPGVGNELPPVDPLAPRRTIGLFAAFRAVETAAGATLSGKI